VRTLSDSMNRTISVQKFHLTYWARQGDHVQPQKLQLAGELVRKDNSRIPGKYWMGNLRNKGCGKLWLRWEGSARKNCLLLLNIRRDMSLAQYKNVWRPSTAEVRAKCRLSVRWGIIIIIIINFWHLPWVWGIPLHINSSCLLSLSSLTSYFFYFISWPYSYACLGFLSLVFKIKMILLIRNKNIIF